MEQAQSQEGRDSGEDSTPPATPNRHESSVSPSVAPATFGQHTQNRHVQNAAAAGGLSRGKDKFRARYLSTLGIWTKDRAKAFSDRSSEEAVGRSRHGSSAHRAAAAAAGGPPAAAAADTGGRPPQPPPPLLPEETLQEPSLEALLLRGKPSTPPIPIARKQLPPPQPHDGRESGTEAETESLASSVETECSADGGGGSGGAAGGALPPRRPPPRRDVRRNYLSKVGIEASSPLPSRPSGAALPLLELDVREERLKDRQDQDLTFDDLVKVLGGLMGVGGGARDQAPRPGQPCEPCRRAHAAASVARTPPPPPCAHKRVRFSETVATVYIPVHRDYSNRVRASYWASAAEIREMVYRNMLEFDAEGYEWRNVAEEEDMYYSEETGEFIHPVFFDPGAQGGTGEPQEELMDASHALCGHGRPLWVQTRLQRRRDAVAGGSTACGTSTMDVTAGAAARGDVRL
ncbi:hypothetical protein JKP88DRAFT_307386 [Tribonema minus]|uniref:Uncharacterized protein n=1 Tax=Tribonema minus TaxID=303371 RepID=A0A836CL05_9STRA|nr:hypothetical protein JKP88DRAFT_307386 [Tribonema minus]